MCFSASIEYMCEHRIEYRRPCELGPCNPAFVTYLCQHTNLQSTWGCQCKPGPCTIDYVYRASTEYFCCEHCMSDYYDKVRNQDRSYVRGSIPEPATSIEFKARELLEQAGKLLKDPVLKAQANFLTLDTPYPPHEIRERILMRGKDKWHCYERLIRDLQTLFLREALWMPTIPNPESTKKKYDLTMRIQAAYIASLIASHEDKHFVLDMPLIRAEQVQTNSLQQDGRVCPVCTREFTDSLIAIEHNPDGFSQPFALNCTTTQGGNKHIVCRSCLWKLACDSRREGKEFACPLCRCVFPIVTRFRGHEVDLIPIRLWEEGYQEWERPIDLIDLIDPIDYDLVDPIDYDPELS